MIRITCFKAKITNHIFHSKSKMYYKIVEKIKEKCIIFINKKNVYIFILLLNKWFF